MSLTKKKERTLNKKWLPLKTMAFRTAYSKSKQLLIRRIVFTNKNEFH